MGVDVVERVSEKLGIDRGPRSGQRHRADRSWQNEFIDELSGLRVTPLENPGRKIRTRQNNVVIIPAGKDLLSKFQASKDAWSSRGFPVLAVGSARTTEFRITASCGVRVFSLNSSLGCGERYFPIEIKDPLTTLLEDYERKVGPIDAFGILGETHDVEPFRIEWLSAHGLTSPTVPISCAVLIALLAVEVANCR